MENAPILAAGRAVQVNNNPQSVIARPSDSLLEIWKLSRNVGFARADFKRAVSDGYADVVQTANRA